MLWSAPSALILSGMTLYTVSALSAAGLLSPYIPLQG